MGPLFNNLGFETIANLINSSKQRTFLLSSHRLPPNPNPPLIIKKNPFSYIFCIIAMNNRLKMLQVNLDSDDSDNQQTKKPPQQKYPIFTDKFQSSTVTKGMFYSPDQEIDYPIFPIKSKPKQQTTQQLQSNHHPQIKIINEIQYDAQDIHKQAQIKMNNFEKNVQESKIQPENGELQQISLQNIISPFHNNKMLQIVLSDEESSSQTQGNQQANANETIVLEKKHPQAKPKPHQRIDPQKLFEGVTDLNEFSRNFNLLPIQPNKFLQLTVFRNSSGLNNFWPEFKVFVGDSNKHILVCKKMMGSTTSNYYITTEQGIEKVDHLNFIAKMRSNFLGSIYNVFDQGVNPEKQSKNNKTRTIQATIKFNSQNTKMEPREFELFMLKSQFKYYDLDGAIPTKEISLDILYEKQGNAQKIHHFKNRKPIYSPSLKGFILNFSGRVQMPSIKNFIMQDSQKRQVLMQGKTTQDIFRVDISSPIPPYIGICVCLANIDSKFISD